jgi:hypothetical protein
MKTGFLDALRGENVTVVTVTKAFFVASIWQFSYRATREFESRAIDLDASDFLALFEGVHACLSEDVPSVFWTMLPRFFAE